MSSSNAYTLLPINAGDVFTCQGNGLMYENITRVPIDELRQLLAAGSGQTLAGNRKESKKWFQAQCAHYGLPVKGVIAALRAQLDTFVTSPAASVPEDILELEAEKNKEYKELNEKIKTITSRARSPTPGRTRRVTITSPTPPPQEPPSTKTPRSRTVSAGPSSAVHSPSADPETQPEPVKRGRGRPRKSEPAPMADRTNTADASPTAPKPDKGKAVATRKSFPRPEPPSQTDSIISTYSELDDEVMEVLDDIEEGFEFMQKDRDGDSQMSSLPSPPRPPVSLPEPRTPRRTQPATMSSPHGHSPRSTLERDVVSGAWSLRIVNPSKQTMGDQQAADSKGTMNLHLAEDKRSLIGEFSLLGMDGVLQSRTLEGRIDGAYARLTFVGQAAANNSQSSNKVFGPSSSQSGYLRFNDGRKASDGKFTLKGALQGGTLGKVDFEGVRDGEEQPLFIERNATWPECVVSNYPERDPLSLACKLIFYPIYLYPV
ncbi:hypothetical protein RSOLAG22IIIB_06242 [Rhizoctonia solani]|uniref:Uncharacterized protein n=1 Tax=Rhizoctonia solani TaxID=456999 RepID=A0A0K6GDA3_9AGAM|nr:hypothetical protein RSOLAG22IIIB_06242 [Rhizoctonia solani]